MMSEIITEVIKAVLIAVVGGIGKVWFDQRVIKSDLNIAFQKIRDLEKKP